MVKLPTAVPNILPEGQYDFEIMDVQIFSSTFGRGNYWKMYFLVRDSDGEHFDFSCTLTPKMTRYHDILTALKLKPDERGFIRPPDDVVGMQFTGEIIQRQAMNDKSKMVNDLRNLKPVLKQKSPAGKKGQAEEEEFDRELDEALPESMR